MALPKISYPMFEIILPISKHKIHYRPYTVAEEKILLIGLQSGETTDIINAIKQVVRNCIQEDIDPGELSTFDLQIILVMLRVISTNNLVTLSYEDMEDHQIRKFTIDLQELVAEAIKNVKIPEREIKLNDELGVTMKHINIDMFMNKDLEDLDDPIKMYSVLGKTIEKVYSLTNEDEVYFLKDFTEEEIEVFVDSFDKKAADNIAEYFKDLPALTKTLTYKTTEGTEREIVLSGLTDFFR